jgi:hypothetical protein
MEDATFVVPDEIEMLEFFGGEAIEREIDDGYWCYAARDGRGLELRFSFNLYERSVQTELRFMGDAITTVSHEGAVRMHRDGSVLRCDFRTTGTKASLAIELAEPLRVQWATLRA